MPFMIGSAGAGIVGSIVGGGKQAKAATNAATIQANAATHAADLNNQQFQQTRTDLQPWEQAGSGALSTLMNQLPSLTAGFTGDPNFKYDPTDFTNDPAFQSAMKLSTNAINTSAAAKGNSLSPAAVKALTQNATDQGNAYYGADYARAENTFNNNFGRAFSTFNSNQSNTFNRLASISQQGLSAGQAVGGFGAQSAAQQGNYLTQAGNAQASGVIGAANGATNAWAGATGGLQSILGGIGSMQNGNSSSYGSSMTPYQPTYPTNGNGI